VGKVKVALIRSLTSGRVSRLFWLEQRDEAVPNSLNNAQSMMRANASPTHRAEKGAEALEFAFVITILMTLVLGFFWFARAYNVYQTITRATREGVRQAVLPSSVADGNTYDGSAANATPETSSSPSTPIFTNYIAPVLQGEGLGTGACSGSSSINCISNYNETVAWINPGEAYQQCGVTISFGYPIRLQIPFVGVGLTTLNLHTSVSMRLENANYQATGAGGTLLPSCP
jgi:Flp pilus assembly protein TadG